ncbi:branched-chain amino acid ABC transporter ATP-binding protein/permease [Amycolatopsis sp.]|uniref:branched-chain amino acid ABC transporter ATP-binding protein/permease n=1 Tax=Amycolatopsis sp. TaxID=37632 RepID=UPI002E01E7BE|nr:branched-chain amino acid ABC transporter ATP-binding protein/permease [Amycolatopsis sp.]
MKAILSRPRAWIVLAGVAALTAVPPLVGDTYYQNMLIMVFLLAIMASGWNIMGGYTGYISLGQSAFLGVGAYTTALSADWLSISPFLAAPLGGVTAGLLATLLGLATYRTRGIAFIIVTFAMLALLGVVALNWSSVTNGSHGLSFDIPTWDIAFANWPFYYLLLLLLALTLLMSWGIRSTRFGVGLMAIRDDEQKAASIGINTPVYKLAGFIASSVPIGIAGGIYGYYLSFLDPRAMFSIVTSITLVLAALLGGVGTLWGPVLGAFLVEPFSQWTNYQFTGPDAGSWRLVLFGGVLLVVVLFMPRGIIPEVQARLRKVRAAGTAGLSGRRLATVAEGGTSGAPEWLTLGSSSTVDTSKPLLEVSGVGKSFGGLHVLDGCSLTVERGSITGLIGPNGSGKTTLFNILDGGLRADTGGVLFDGKPIDGLNRWERSHRGLGRTHQLTRLFPRLTALENVVAGVRGLSLSGLRAPAMTGAEAAKGQELLDFVGLGDYRAQPVGGLSYGQQKLVELAQVLMLEPSLVLLDEPAGGINPTQIEQMVGLIRELNRAGTTFLIVEHNMPMVLTLCGSVRVLAGGHCIASGSPQQVQSDPLVLDAYLGADFRPLQGTEASS